MPETTVEDPTETEVEAPVVTKKTVEELELENERIAKALKKANDEAAKLRLKEKKLAEIEEAEEAKKTEKLGEDEKLRKSLAAAQAAARDAQAERETASRELHQVRLERAIEAEARKQNFPNPIKVAKLIDRELIDYDAEAKKFVGLVEAVKAVAREYPEELFTDGIRRGGGTPSGTGAPHPRQVPANNGQFDPIPALQQSLRSGNSKINYDV